MTSLRRAAVAVADEVLQLITLEDVARLRLLQGKQPEASTPYSISLRRTLELITPQKNLSSVAM